jgi:hypothetical protein
MENKENTIGSSKNFLQQAYEYITKKEEDDKAREVAKEAEEAGDYKSAVLILEEACHDHGTEQLLDLRRKWSEKEEANGNFEDAAGILFTVFGGKETAPIAERAEAAGNFEDAHYIYRQYVYDFEKAASVYQKWAEQKIEAGDFFTGAKMFDGIKMPEEKIWEIVQKAEAAGNFEDGVIICEEVLNNYGDKWYELRRKWAENLVEAKDYVSAADVMIKTKDRAFTKKIADMAREKGDLRSANVIRVEILHIYDEETAAIEKEEEFSPWQKAA